MKNTYDPALQFIIEKKTSQALTMCKSKIKLYENWRCPEIQLAYRPIRAGVRKSEICAKGAIIASFQQKFDATHWGRKCKLLNVPSHHTRHTDIASNIPQYYSKVPSELPEFHHYLLSIYKQVSLQYNYKDATGCNSKISFHTK